MILFSIKFSDYGATIVHSTSTLKSCSTSTFKNTAPLQLW